MSSLSPLNFRSSIPDLSTVIRADTLDVIRHFIVRIIKSGKTYTEICKNAYSCDVSLDHNFQRLFTSFYKIRRDRKWKECFFYLFEQTKYAQCDVSSFKSIIHNVYALTGAVESSIVSKMMAVINPDLPVLDNNVLRSLNVIAPSNLMEKDLRIEASSALYEALYDKFLQFYQTEIYLKYTNFIDTVIPEISHLSDARKVDLYLCSLTDSKIRTIFPKSDNR